MRRLSAGARFDGAAEGWLSISWNDDGRDAVATASGTVGGAPVDLILPAP